jgi:REP element-mobilizing transposase RayT
MSKKYLNKYRIGSHRLKNWDYRNSGAYFITINAKNRNHFFGEIIVASGENRMELSDIGLLAEKYWLEIPDHFPHIELGTFQVMPNHFHGILIVKKMETTVVDDDTVAAALHIDKNAATSMQRNDAPNNESLQRNDTPNNESLQRNDAPNNESLQRNDAPNNESLQCNDSTVEPNYYSEISPKSGSISTIIRSYKSIVSKNARYINHNFEWQPKFHDHIIRNSESFERIQNYIANNPNNWKEDKFFN